MVEERLDLFSQILHFFWVWIWIWIIRFMAIFNTIDLLVATFATLLREFSPPWLIWVGFRRTLWFKVVFTTASITHLAICRAFSLIMWFATEFAICVISVSMIVFWVRFEAFPNCFYWQSGWGYNTQHFSFERVWILSSLPCTVLLHYCQFHWSLQGDDPEFPY